ncbi:MAG: hypothetical protein E6J90_22095 [Deltaproteobacteria bacterium]|nr:MAG: hypothetical protein E6J90_22095 [Deltaproteobacteria bacterium]
MLAASGIALFIATGNGRAHAQNAEAESLFAEGNKLMAEGKLADACDAFEASNRAEPRAGTLIRLGECREQNQQYASAWSAYKDALNRVKDPRKRQFATGKAAALAARLSYLTISVPDDSRVDGLTLTRNGKPLDPTLWNRALPVDGGAYIIAGRAPGHEEWQTTARVPGEGGKISVEVPKFKEIAALLPAPTPTPPPPAPVEPAPPPSAPVETVETGWSARRKIALGAAATSVLALAAGTALGLSARSKQSDAHALCPDPQAGCDGADRASDLVRSGHNLAISADVAFGVAGVTAIAAGVLWFTGGQDARRRVAVVPVGAPGLFAIAARGSF